MLSLKYRVKKDWPVKDVNFIDLTPDMADSKLFKSRIDEMVKIIPNDIDYIIAPEARGFIYGTSVAIKKQVGFIPVRKPNKLPEDFVETIEYEKEYGKDILCIPKGDYKGKKFYIIDDVLATGGTVEAIIKLIEKVEGKYVGASFILDLEISKNENNYNSLFKLKDLNKE